jgi:putative Mn2+ efflux pump MntP
MTAVGHVGLSLLFGFTIVEIGVTFSQRLSGYITEATGAIMVVAGLLYGVKELMSKVSEDYEKEAREKLAKGEGGLGKRFRYFAVLGGALSPDLSILPIFILAAPIGLSFAVETAAVFSIASVLALLVFLLLGSAGLAKMFERIPPKYNDALVGFVIAAVGLYILLAG